MSNQKQEVKIEDWMQKKWRPAMGWMYMAICLCDMVIFPVAWSMLQAVLGQTVSQWNPLTLQGAGLFHLAMGAVLGIAAWGRTQEKVAGASTLTTSVGYSSSTMQTNSFNNTPSFTPMERPPIRRVQTHTFEQSEFMPGQSPKFTDD